jgi:hypothetical protein
MKDGSKLTRVFQLNWYGAQKICTQQGGYLVSVEDSAENQAILDAIRKFC